MNRRIEIQYLSAGIEVSNRSPEHSCRSYSSYIDNLHFTLFNAIIALPILKKLPMMTKARPKFFRGRMVQSSR